MAAEKASGDAGTLYLLSVHRPILARLIMTGTGVHWPVDLTAPGGMRKAEDTRESLTCRRNVILAAASA